jgi:hypothetical protein
MKQHHYTPEERQFLKDNVAGRSYAELTDMFNRKFNLSCSVIMIKNISSYFGLKNGILSKFHIVGHYDRCPIGQENICNSKGYILVKIANPSVWRYKHKLVWEAANGPVPEGHVILFADGNKLNINLDNLLLVSTQELAVMNKRHLIFPAAGLTKCGLMIAKFILFAKDGERKLKEREQCKPAI